MSMEEEDITTEQETDPGIKDLREAANRSKANAADAAAAKRENAFLKAGVDTDAPLGKLAMTGYDGDLEVDKIKEFMASLGPAVPAVTETEQFTEEEALSTQARQRLGSGAGAPSNDPPPTDDPNQAGLLAFHEARKAGSSAEDASAQFFDRVFDAAAKGDSRVLIPQSNNF